MYSQVQEVWMVTMSQSNIDNYFMLPCKFRIKHQQILKNYKQICNMHHIYAVMVILEEIKILSINNQIVKFNKILQNQLTPACKGTSARAILLRNRRKIHTTADDEWKIEIIQRCDE